MNLYANIVIIHCMFQAHHAEESLLKAYTVNNMTDLCGGLRFSWSEWISLSTLLCCSLSNEKERTIAAKINHPWYT